MTGRRPPERWLRSEAAIRAVQVAFDVEEDVITAVRRAAFESGLSTSDQVRVVLGLPVIRQPKRPRLTVSLSPDDYVQLGARYGLAADDRLAIKEQVIADLIRFSESGKAAGVTPEKPVRRHRAPLIEPPPPSPQRGRKG